MTQKDEIKSIVDGLRIASPCPMDWDAMQRTPEEAVRFCGQCSKNVYNIAQMSTKDAALLLQKAQANQTSACMQLYRRADGTVITDDCPVGLRRIRDFWRKAKAGTAAAVALVFAGLPSFSQSAPSGQKATGAQSKCQKPAPDQNVEMGKPMAPANQANTPQRGDVMVPTPLRGAVAPAPLRGEATIPLTGGVPAPTDWRKIALANPEVKKLSDQIDALAKKGSPSNDDKAKISKLRLDMAKAAQKANVPYFAMQELEKAQKEAEALSGQKGLLRDILNARIANGKLLGTNTDSLTKQLQELEKAK